MNTGQGIDPKDYASVFEPLTRIAQTPKALDRFSEDSTDTLRSDNAGKKTNQIDGTGLGLSIVKSICEQANIDVFMKASTLTATSGEDSYV